jgi:endo-1,4-beta-xylanase
MKGFKVMIRFRSVAIAAAALAALSLCAQAQTTLKDAYKNFFYIGTAVSQAQFNEQDARGNPIIAAQFNTISPENVLKWESVHPRVDGYAFEQADRYVAYGEKYHMWIVGHNLVWHSQTPQWVFQDDKGGPLTRDALLQRMHDHIMTVVGRYKGRIQSWDVVNEALNEDGTLRNSNWRKIIGDDYLAKAFQYAHEADPKAELNYNDYNLENEAKRNGAVALVKQLKDQGIPITAVGLQGHDNMEWPTLQQQDDTIAAFKALGVKVCITELDVDVLPAAGRAPTADVSATAAGTANSNPYVNGLPDAVQQALAKRYADLFGVYLKYRGTVTRVTLWGVTDGDSWKNDFPVRGRTNYPLLFDRAGKAKPAVDALIKAARAAAGH